MNKWLAGITGWSARSKQFAIIVAIVVGLDQLSKYWAISRLTHAFDAFGGEPGFGERLWRFLWLRHPGSSGPVSVLDNFWHFRYTENPGAAWSFLAWAPHWFRVPFLLAVAAAAMVFIVLYFRKTAPYQRTLHVALACVFGGAMGNFLDRLRLGYVIDFVEWHWFERATWPIFNVADAAISIGVGLMILDMILHKQPAPATGSASGAAAKGKSA